MSRIILPVLLLVAFTANLFLGSVYIAPERVWAIITGNVPFTEPDYYIVLQRRLPAAIAAMTGGAALAVAGLLMQTAFRNPLAGPSIMGINSGASLGVAIVTLVSGGALAAAGMQLSGQIIIITAALAGSLAVMVLLIALSSILNNNLLLLITAILIGYLISSVITILNASATSQSLQNYVMWGMGSFQNVTAPRLPGFIMMVTVGFTLAALLIKPLDALLLGDNYATNLGVNIRIVRSVLLLSTGILASAVTAYCGPIAFIGLSVPHIARMFTGTDIHKRLLPATLLTGAVIALLCNIVCLAPLSGLIPGLSSSSTLPLNAVTPLFGVPVILYVIIKVRNQQ